MPNAPKNLRYKEPFATTASIVSARHKLYLEISYLPLVRKITVIREANVNVVENSNTNKRQLSNQFVLPIINDMEINVIKTVPPRNIEENINNVFYLERYWGLNI